jgi:hypothetical protein
LHQAAKSIRSIWDAFLDYEADLTTMIADKPITLLCTYDEAYLASGNGTSRAAASFFTLSKRKVDSRSFFRAQDRAVDDFTMHGTSSRPRSWREAWALFPGSVGLYLARRDQGGHRAGQLSRLRLRDPRANHLGEKQLRDRPRPLPLQARAVRYQDPF